MTFSCDCSVVLALNRLCYSLRKRKNMHSLCKGFCFALPSESGIAHTENKEVVHVICPAIKWKTEKAKGPNSYSLGKFQSRVIVLVTSPKD